MVRALQILCNVNVTWLRNGTRADGYYKVEQIKLMHYYAYGVVIPIVCVLGFIGNILNIFAFSWKRHQRVIEDIEKCTTTCLIALAISDMLFCLTTFPNAFTRDHVRHSHGEFMLYYRAFSIAVINTFIMSSTILTVITAIMRYIAICHPFHSSLFISMVKTIAGIVGTFLFSALFNLPYLWRYSIVDNPCAQWEAYLHPSEHLFESETFEYVYRVTWAIIGNFIPLTVLMYCNIRLIHALRLSRRLRVYHCRDDTTRFDAHRRITLTLIAIIVLFLVLVAPCDTVKFVLNISGHKSNGELYYSYQVTSIITNVLQSVNFSINFILYYAMITPFRKTLNDFICLAKRRSRSSGNGSARPPQTVILLSLRGHGAVS